MTPATYIVAVLVALIVVFVHWRRRIIERRRKARRLARMSSYEWQRYVAGVRRAYDEHQRMF